ncbi:MAG: L-serine ammonia-lyase, iron-sulfur-dependent, subunit alpha [Desulfovibrio sp.]|jgi:L-cysteine desulfidase|nr:L-serine ammonia-lyase, iron-sulfur-dependent, subunit alpha [Desulfovibrio sp.]
MGYSIKDILHNKAQSLIRLETEPGLGCTEPASIALCAAVAASALENRDIEEVTVTVDANIYKNAMGVIIPNSDGDGGVGLAAALGAVSGDHKMGLRVFSSVDAAGLDKAKALLAAGKVTAKIREDAHGLYVNVTLVGAGHTAEATIKVTHDNVVALRCDGIDVLKVGASGAAVADDGHLDRLKQWLLSLSLSDLLDIIEEMDANDFRYIREGLALNTALVEYGLAKGPGIAAGRTQMGLVRRGVLKKDMARWAAIRVAAGIDSRMGGVPLPAMTLAGSGNQGIAAGIPIPAVAEFAVIEDETVLLRAVTLSYLVTCYIKAAAGLLSALCGSGIAGGAGVAAATAYLFGATREQTGDAVNNHLGCSVAVVCDGAKTGCAFKVGNLIGQGVNSALLALNGCAIRSTDGIVGKTAETTMRDMGVISSQGLSGMDPAILGIMLAKHRA